jgi:very-short-patch-repair endonuclease
MSGPAVSPVSRRGIPTTNPVRSLLDFSSVAAEGMLDNAVDRVLARQLVTVEGILAEIGHESRPGRSGLRALRASLRRRGYVGAPNPSVLESKFLRLLRRYRLDPLAVEVQIDASGRYRVDSAISEDLFVEVDGHAYHHSPEQKVDDERRRNRIRLSGKFLLVYTWRDVVHDERRVIAEIRQALAQGDNHRRDSLRRGPGQEADELTGAALRPPVL